jgi:hypothetical protein
VFRQAMAELEAMSDSLFPVTHPDPPRRGRWGHRIETDERGIRYRIHPDGEAWTIYSDDEEEESKEEDESEEPGM